MKRYNLKNLSCANCAANLETSLRKLDSVRFVSINMALSTMDLETEDFREAMAEIKKTEPEVEVSETRNADQDQNGKRFSAIRILSVVAVSTVLFIVGLLFQEELANTPFSVAEYAVFLIAYLLSGWTVLFSAGRNILRGKVFDENFLMSIATIGAIAIHQLPEAVGVMIFFKVGEFFQDLSISRSRRSIKALLESRPDYANLKVDGALTRVLPEKLSVGDEVVVKAGEKVPVDGTIIDGDSQIDTSALTGESVPRLLKTGDSVLAGMINKTKVLTVCVTKPFSESSMTRILDLVQNALGRKANTEKFITRFARYYTPFVVGIAAAVALLPPLFLAGATFTQWLYRALILLVISCPCALSIYWTLALPPGNLG